MPGNEPVFKSGDSVIVKPNVKDPEFGIDLGGWVGRIKEVYEETVLLEWDSVSLSNMPSDIIKRCEQDGVDWATMGLDQTDVEPTKPRDTPTQVMKMRERQETAHQWDHLTKDDPLIESVLRDVKSGDYLAAFDAWEKFLEKTLQLPFEARIAEYQERGPLRKGDKVKVLAVAGNEDPYGVIVTVSYEKEVFTLALCELEVVGKKSPNYKPVESYSEWFSNR